MASNKSIGIWCTPAPDKGPIEVEVHFNYWRIQPHTTLWSSISTRGRETSNGDFFEVGVMVKDIRNANKIHIFIPTPLSRDNICDCSRYFAEHEIAQGIFNEPLKVAHEPDGEGPLVIRHGGNNRIYCRMHNFSTLPNSTSIIEPQLELQVVNGGTICTIENQAIKACRPGNNHKGKAYFRLRFRVSTNKTENPFVENIPVFDRFVLSGYEHVEYLDFRLNDARTLPTEVERRMKAEQPPGAMIISLVAFLTAVPVSAALSVTHTAFHKMRLLENEIWTKYAEGIPNGMVVYHWRKDSSPKRPIEDFSAFVKLQIRLSGGQILSKYLLFALIFGVFGNLVASFLQSHLPSFFSSIWEILTSLLGAFEHFKWPVYLGNLPIPCYLIFSFCARTTS